MARPGCETFLIPVKTFTALPPGAASALASVQPLTSLRTMLLIPPQPFLVSRIDWLRRPWFATRTTARRLLAFNPSQITVVEEANDGTWSPVVIPIECLLAIRFTTVLLLATLEWIWASENGPQTLSLRFNAVGEHFVHPDVRAVRAQRAGARQGGLALSRDATRLQAASLPLKFRNYLWLSMLDNDAVVQLAYEPAIRDSSYFHRLVAPRRLVVLTERELIVLEDVRSAEYGIGRLTCPLAALADVRIETLAKNDGLRLTFRAGMASHDVVLPLSSHNIQRLQRALDYALSRRHQDSAPELPVGK